MPAISLMGFNLLLKLSIFSAVFVADVGAEVDPLQAVGATTVAAFVGEASAQSEKQSKSLANAAGDVNAITPMVARRRIRDIDSLCSPVVDCRMNIAAVEAFCARLF